MNKEASGDSGEEFRGNQNKFRIIFFFLFKSWVYHAHWLWFFILWYDLTDNMTHSNKLWINLKKMWIGWYSKKKNKNK